MKFSPFKYAIILSVVLASTACQSTPEEAPVEARKARSITVGVVSNPSVGDSEGVNEEAFGAAVSNLASMNGASEVFGKTNVHAIAFIGKLSQSDDDRETVLAGAETMLTPVCIVPAELKAEKNKIYNKFGVNANGKPAIKSVSPGEKLEDWYFGSLWAEPKVDPKGKNWIALVGPVLEQSKLVDALGKLKLKPTLVIATGAKFESNEVAGIPVLILPGFLEKLPVFYSIELNDNSGVIKCWPAQFEINKTEKIPSISFKLLKNS